MSGDVELAGRTRELAVAVDIMSSSSQALTVIGEAGVGKSRLVAEASRATEERGRVVLRGQCLSLATSLPLLPFLDVLRALVKLNDGQIWSSVLEGCQPSVRGEISRLLPDTADRLDGPQDPDWHSEGQRERLFDAVGALLTAANERHGVAVVIEDMHWADQATVDLVEYLMSPSHRVSAPLVLTFRTNDPASPGADAWLGRLPRTPAMTVLTLTPLAFEDATKQIRSLAGRELPITEIETLYARSEGNPFFVEQLVQSVLELGPGGSVRALPEGLTSLLLSRTETVTGSAQEVMACLAVAGRDVDELFLAECCAKPAPTIRRALRELADRRLLRAGTEQGLRLSHALLAEVVTMGLLPDEVRDWHRRVAEAMARQDNMDAAGAVAEHFRYAGLDLEELRWRLLAARQCQLVFARAEAAEHWVRAITLLESPLAPSVPEGTTPASIFAFAAISLKLSGDAVGATSLAKRGLEKYGNGADPATRAALLTGFSYDPRNRDPQAVRDALRQAVEIYEQLPPEWGYLRAAHDYWVSYQATADPETALPILDRALAVAPNAGAPMPHFLLLMDRALLHLIHGEVDAAFGRLSEAHGLLAIIGDPLVDISYATVHTDILNRLGRLEEVLPVAEGLGSVWTESNQTDKPIGILRCNVFEALTALGDVDGAAAVIEPVTRGAPQPRAWFEYAARAKLEMLRGRLAESEKRWATLPRQADPAVDCEIEPWRLELQLWQRRPQEALNQAVDIMEELVDTSESRNASQILLMAVRAHADVTILPTGGGQPPTSEAALSLKDLHSRMPVDPLSPGPLRPTADADALSWEAEWARAARVGETTLWDAAATAYEAHNRPHAAAYALWREAEALLASNGRQRAAAALLHAARLADQHDPLRTAIAKLAARAHVRLKDASTPQVATARPFGLTNREMTVLALIGNGDTNARIGAKLFISERTASVHVSNILRKLGVSSRIQAANIAEQLGLFPGND